MKPTIVYVEGVPLYGRQEAERLLLPLANCAEALGAEIKSVPGLERPALCQGDLCIPLDAGGRTDTHEVDGVTYVYTDFIEEAMGYHVQSGKDGWLLTKDSASTGGNPGDLPPAFTLPDMRSGDPVSVSDYLGRKVVFYMWASW